MKHIEIAGNEFELFYGLAFIREMDKRYSAEYSGLQYGMGIRFAVMYLLDENPVALQDIIEAALITHTKKPKEQEIEAWLEEQEDLETLFTDFLTSLENSKFTAGTAKKVKKSVGVE